MSKRKRYKKKPDVSIIIPVFGRFDLLDKCLKSIPDACGDKSYQVVLFDNASPDRDEAEEYYDSLDIDNVIVSRSNENLGFPIACNRGVNRSKADIVFLLNSDVVLLPGAVESMMQHLKDPEIGVVGMKLLFPEESVDGNRPAGKIQHVGLTLDIKGQFLHAFIAWSKDNPRVNRVFEVGAVTGAALMTKRTLWYKVGGFFEGYGIGTYEDCDLCYSIREKGYKVIVDVNAVGYHYTNATASFYKIPFPLGQNRQIFLQRWGKQLEYDEWRVL